MQFPCCYNGLDGWPSTSIKNKEQSRRAAAIKENETLVSNPNTNDFVPDDGPASAGIVDTMTPSHHD